MTTRVAVLKCQIYATPQLNAARQVEILARVTVELGPVVIVGAALCRRDTGDYFLQLPSAGRDRRIFIHDRDAYTALRAAVIAAYEAPSASRIAHRCIAARDGSPIHGAFP